MNFSIFDVFMLVYLKELESNTDLLENLGKVVFHLDEANSDKQAKSIIKDFMLRNPTVSTDCDLEIHQETQILKYPSMKFIHIRQVYLQDELTEPLKELIKSKKSNSVYTNPDIFIELSNGKETEFFSVELKSTKKNEIPGSSVQQINHYEWVIFIKQGKPIEITTGLYLNSITEKVQFPDRSPRPQVAFNTLKNWNKNNFISENNSLIFKITQSEWDNKNQLIRNWKITLVEQWLKVVLDENLTLTSRSPWFNETLIMYTDKLLAHYEQLSKIDKEKLRDKLKYLLKD